MSATREPVVTDHSLPWGEVELDEEIDETPAEYMQRCREYTRRRLQELRAEREQDEARKRERKGGR